MPTELDLSGLAPATVRIRLTADDVIDVSSDQPSLLVAQASQWLDDWNLGNAGNDRMMTDEDGWSIAEKICGQDVQRIGVLGLVKLLHFFRLQTLQALQAIYSELPFELPGSSTAVSPSENSSVVEGS